MVFRRDSYNEHNTTRGGARLQCGSVIVATSLHAVDPAVDPNHDADIRIGSEAPKWRLPNLFPGMKAMGGCEQPLPRIVLGIVAYKRRGRQNLSFRFLLLHALFCCCLCR